MNGKIKKIIQDRGFGFIKREGDRDLFFFHKACANVLFEDLKEGDAVTFEVEESDRGPRAIKVCRP